MLKDTRSRNTYFNRSDLSRYVKEYGGALASALMKVEPDDLDLAYGIIKHAHVAGGRIFVGGNGGSAAISDHLCCDFTKGIMTQSNTALQVKSLVGDTALMTAIANDIGYDQVFSQQLEIFEMSAKDVLVLISSSGNSANIRTAYDFAKSRGASVVGLTGFDGGYLKKHANACLHINSNNYGVIEDAHQSLMHILAQFHYLSMNP